MADVTPYRPYASGRGGVSPTTIYVKLESGESGVPGALVRDDDNDGQANIGNAQDQLIGILEEDVSSSSENDLAAVSLFIPGMLWEISNNDVEASVAHIFDGHNFAEHSDGYAVVNAGTGSSPVMILEYMGDTSGTFETHAYIGANDTSETAGSRNYPYAQPLGGTATLFTSGSKNARALCSIIVSATVLGGSIA